MGRSSTDFPLPSLSSCWRVDTNIMDIHEGCGRWKMCAALWVLQSRDYIFPIFVACNGQICTCFLHLASSPIILVAETSQCPKQRYHHRHHPSLSWIGSWEFLRGTIFAYQKAGTISIDSQLRSRRIITKSCLKLGYVRMNWSIE